MSIHWKAIFQIVGIMLTMIGCMMLVPLMFSLYYHSGDSQVFLWSAFITTALGMLCWRINAGQVANVKKRDGYLIVTLGWIFMIASCSLPFFLSGHFAGATNALFETVSGMTTTGATIVEDIELLPEGLLFWRSMIQWIGGMGIIVLTVAIFPLLGIGGWELFVNEAPGPVSQKIHPRIRATAASLWIIYLTLTAILCALLMFGGMQFFDSINHAMTTMATGGFSTKNASFAHFQSPYLHYVTTLFMFLAGVNYTLIFFAIRFDLRKVFRSEELKYYFSSVVLFGLLVTCLVKFSTGQGWEISFRQSFFQVVSMITTTGYVITDYTSWSNTLTIVFFVLLFLGASAGSTAGGIKIVRHVVFFKNSILEFKRLLHPRAIIRLKLDKEIVRARIVMNILVFLLLYLATFITGTVVVVFLGMDLISAGGAVATSLGNVGPGIGVVGPMHTFAGLSIPIKWVLITLMLLGRLELYTVLILFTPFFWRSN